MPPVKKPHHARQKTFLREWRKYFGISQDDAASRVEIDRTTLSKIERRVFCDLKINVLHTHFLID